MMIIHIKEDGSTSVQTAGYTALYDKEGKPKVTIGEAPATLVVHNAFKQKAEKEQATPTQTLAEQVDRINGRRYDAGITLSVDEGAKAGITSDSFKVFEAVIDGKAIREKHDDHIRQIVREEIRQFVTRESGRGGLLSKW
ncbi:hypothetical protein [Xenorhabdus bovienii]|uniref:hypothetical protein n=1 Tax=Xenorhabdus bovienii TaxID=40576 RepID=UPI003DA27806